MPAPDTHRAIDAVWRIEQAKIIGALTRLVRDVGAAEELAQDALVAALEQWPRTGIPDRPGAWLMAAAKHRAIDLLRRNARLSRKLEEIGASPVTAAPDYDAALDDDVGDDVLRLMLVACHPVLTPEMRVALTLRLLGGLTVQEIARAFLVPEPTIQQRIVRAKRALAAARAPFEVPRGEERAARVSSVLAVLYLIFNEGYSATAGDDLIRPQLCHEALRLGRTLAALADDQPEAHGLVALMELQASRLAARVSPRGDPVLLLDQDRSRWDRLLIRRGLAALERAESRARSLGQRQGPYALQAAIAACHARAVTPDDTDWPRIVALYEALGAVAGSPIVDLNRAVAVSYASGPAAALAIVDEVAADPVLRNYPLVAAVRGDLLTRLDRRHEARAEFERAASLTRNLPERALLLRRAADCSASEPSAGVVEAGDA